MSRSSSISFKLSGLDDIRKVLTTLPRELQDKVMRVAVQRAAKPLVSSAKLFAGRSRKTGALVESIGAVVKKGKKGGVYAVVGPRRGYYRGGLALKKGTDRRGANSPAHYAHLVEYGHNVVAPIKGTTRRKNAAKSAANGKAWVAAKPFLRPALMASESAVIGEMAAGVQDGIAKQLKRLVKNPKAIR